MSVPNKHTKVSYLETWFSHIERLREFPTFDRELHEERMKALEHMKRILVQASTKMYYFLDGDGYEKLLEAYGVARP